MVVAAVTTAKPVLGVKEVKEAVKKRESKGLFIIDISQPRFFEEKVGSVEHVTLRNIDDLKGIVEENIGKRMGESEKAKKIIFDELKLFENQLGRIMAEPVISKICGKIEEIRKREIKRAFGKMKETDERKRLVIERFSRELIERMLQIPIGQLREAVLNNNSEFLNIAEKLFGITHEKREA
jgi:glutamyl-tRNA reductase